MSKALDQLLAIPSTSLLCNKDTDGVAGAVKPKASTLGDLQDSKATVYGERVVHARSALRPSCHLSLFSFRYFVEVPSSPVLRMYQVSTAIRCISRNWNKLQACTAGAVVYCECSFLYWCVISATW